MTIGVRYSIARKDAVYTSWVGERVSGVYVLCACFPGIVPRVISARKAVGYAEWLLDVDIMRQPAVGALED